MNQISSLRLLLTNSTPIFFLKPTSTTTTRTLFHPIKPLFPVFSKYPRKLHTSNYNNPSNRRGISRLGDPKKVEKMEESGFNKRRAEGKDNNDKPKNLQLKVRKLNPVNTISYVQILGTGMDTQDTSPSVLLFFDKQRFIFNAGEGLQRFCTEHKIKLSKIDHIFLSRVCSETAGGLPGLLLTMAAIGDEGMCVNMWGPSDLNFLVDAMKTFIPNAAMVHTNSFWESKDLIDDEVVKISAILLKTSSTSGSPSHSDNSDHGSTIKSGNNSALGSAVKPGDVSVIYVCELPEIQGRFDPEKAKALGLRPGPKYRELQNNKSVKSDNLDITVHPKDVMDPPIPGPIVLLVDCPTVSHLQSLLSVDSLNLYYSDNSGCSAENAKAVNCVIHLSPSSVSSSPDYQRWMKRFGSAHHIMAGHERKNAKIPVLKSSARIAARLNHVCPQFFPAPGFWSHHSVDNTSPRSNSVLKDPPVTISAENLLKFNLRPYANLGLDRSSIPSSTSPAKIVDELLAEIPEIVDAAQQVRQLWDQSMKFNSDAVSQNNSSVVEEPWLDEIGLPSCLENISREDMEIVLLGTGSSQPSKYRNVSSVYIDLFAKGSLLFDCGEGTLGQLKRRYGVEGADEAVRKLRCIWISHIHADHHTGLARILALRRDLLKEVPHEPLLVVGPGQLLRFLNAYQRLEDLDMQFLDCKHTTKASWDTFESSLDSNVDQSEPSSSGNGTAVDSTLFAKGSPMRSVWNRPGSPVGTGVTFQRLNHLKKVLQHAGIQSLISFPVVHCPQAYGVSLKAAQRIDNVGEIVPGLKVVYSGDTRPCPQLVDASRGATVLIHEATFEDGLVDEAVARNHSTTKEAIEVGEEAGVYRIILTHFSQRYPKIPVFGEAHMHNTCIGFDLMSINMADLPVLPRVLPHLKLLFRNEMVVDEAEDLPQEAVAAAS